MVNYSYPTMLKRATTVFAGLLLAVAVGPAAWGQSLPLGADTVAAPVTLPSLSTLRYDRTDTLRAVQHLFMRHCSKNRGPGARRKARCLPPRSGAARALLGSPMRR